MVWTPVLQTKNPVMANVYVEERLESERLVMAAKGCSMGIREEG